MADKKKKSAAPAGNVVQVPSAIDHSPTELHRIGEQVVHGRFIAGSRERFGYAANPDDLKALGALGWTSQRIALNLSIVDSIEVQLGKRGNVEAAARQSAEPMWESHGALVGWVKLYKVIVRAPKKIADAAPRAPRNWSHATQIEAVIEPLAKFVETNQAALASRGGTAAFAAQGRQLAKAFASQRAGHQGDASLSTPETATLRQLEGAVFLELEDLSAAAHALLSPARAALYDVRALYGSGSGHHRPSAPGPQPTTPAAN